MKPVRRPSAALLGVAGLLATILAGLGLSVARQMRLAPQTSTQISYMPMVFRSNTPTPAPSGTPLPVTPPVSGDWHDVLGYYRASARLPGLGENLGWSDGAFQHARYMVKNDVLTASEVNGAPWYSQAGAEAAPSSNLILTDNTGTSDRQALDSWMAKPFHALGVIDPALLSTGFGSFREDAGQLDPFKMGAALDVRRGLGAIPGSVQFPVKWPEHNATVYLTLYDGTEQPDPLSSCSGFSPPSGLPIILQLGPGSVTPAVTAHSFKRGTTNLAHCIFDETNYANSIAELQVLGRGLLNASDAVVLIPQAPLTAGDYTASITANGVVTTWTFHVAP